MEPRPRKKWKSAVPPVAFAWRRLEEIDVRLGLAPGGKRPPAWGRLAKDLQWQRRFWESRLRDALQAEGFRAPADQDGESCGSQAPI